MLMLGENSVDDIHVDDVDNLEYHKIPESEAWRVGLLKELVAIREDEGEVPGMTNEEVEEIMDYICTTQDSFFIQSNTHKTVTTVLESIKIIIIRVQTWKKARTRGHCPWKVLRIVEISGL